MREYYFIKLTILKWSEATHTNVDQNAEQSKLTSYSHTLTNNVYTGTKNSYHFNQYIISLEQKWKNCKKTILHITFLTSGSSDAR